MAVFVNNKCPSDRSMPPSRSGIETSLYTILRADIVNRIQRFFPEQANQTAADALCIISAILLWRLQCL